MVFLEPSKDRLIYKPNKERGAFGFPPPAVLRIYCCEGREKIILNLFNTVTFHIEIDDEDAFQQFGISSDPQKIREDYHNHKSLFSFNLLSRNKKRFLKFNPFNTSCIGIESASEYKVNMQLIRIDFWRVSLMVIGFAFLFLATKFSQNSAFYYLCGVLLGVFASFLVMIYFISKLIPRVSINFTNWVIYWLLFSKNFVRFWNSSKSEVDNNQKFSFQKTLMYGVMASGWTLAIYFAQMIFENIQPILVTYQTYVFWYIGKWSNHSISNSAANQIDFLFFHSNNWLYQLYNLLSIGPT